MDIVSVKKRSEIMSKVRSRDTKPERLFGKSFSAWGSATAFIIETCPVSPTCRM